MGMSYKKCWKKHLALFVHALLNTCYHPQALPHTDTSDTMGAMSGQQWSWSFQVISTLEMQTGDFPEAFDSHYSTVSIRKVSTPSLKTASRDRTQCTEQPLTDTPFFREHREFEM